MKKYFIFALCAILLVGGLAGCGSKKENKKDNEDEKTVVEQTFEIDDTTLDTLDIVSIVVETRNDESVLRFIIKNNSDEVYPEGMISLDIYDGDKLLGQTSTFITEIPAHNDLSVEVVINSSYSNVTDVKVSN